MSETTAPDSLSTSTSERVELDLPLHVRHASTVRAVSCSIAADSGLSVDDIEDLRLGVNEVVSVVADADHNGDARLIVTFEFGAGSVRFAARRTGVESPLSDQDIDPLAERILRAVTDEFFVDAATFVVVKHAS
jgi:anti-sigma regulatory factor (Ser/Thr protein kinase)